MRKSTSILRACPITPEISAALKAEKQRRHTENRLAYYSPYPKQAEFHAAGATFRERLLMAANQVGKTWAGGSEAAMHVTGRYPADWKGKRFDRPTSDGRAARRTRLCATPCSACWSVVPVPRAPARSQRTRLLSWSPARGIADALDMIRVKHVSGGTSQSSASRATHRAGRNSRARPWISFGSTKNRRRTFTPKGLTRTNVGSGPVWMTFTPLKGVSEVVRRFLLEKSPDRHVTTMTIDDAEHYSAGGAHAHHRQLSRRTKRKRGPRAFRFSVPAASSRSPRKRISDEHRDFPTHWPRIGGMDFGWDHPFAAVELVWDRDTDTVYVARTHRLKEASPVMHAGRCAPGASCAGRGRVTAGAKHWKALASRCPGNTPSKASTCSIPTRNSRTAACRSKPV